MKAVMISIQPKWVEKIANGEKTIEVRKTAPKCEVLFKCYIYCSKDNANEIVLLKNYKNRFIFGDYRNADGHFYTIANGKVIGEFICDNAEWMSMRDCDKACMTLKEAVDYGKGKKLYAWHISDLKIYDKPKELSEFWKVGKCPYATENGCTYNYHCFRAGQMNRCGETLTRPPQSWQYVEELQE